MAARVQIIVEAKDAASGILRGLTSQMGSFGSLLEEVTAKNVNWGNLAAQATGMVVEGLKESYKAFQDYAGQVRDLAIASGTTATEASRLLQVLDDFQIGAEDVTVAMRAMKEKGIVPTVETLAQLSEQFLAIEDPAKRLEFAQDNLGRSSAKFLNVLSQGPDVIREMSDAVSDNLILSDAQIKAAEEQRLAMDALADAWQGFKVQLGAATGEIILSIKRLEEQQEMERRVWEQGKKVVDVYYDGERAGLVYEEEVVRIGRALEIGAEMTDFYNQQLRDNQEIVEDVTVNYKDLIGNIQNYQGAIDDYNETNSELRAKEAELIKEREKMLAQLDLARRYYGANSRKAQEAAEKLEGIDKALAENNASFAENKQKMDEWAAQTVYNFALARAGADGSISEIEGEILVNAGEALGLFDEKTAETMRSVNQAFDTLDASNAEQVINTLLEQLHALTDNPWNITINTGGNAGGPGGGGGGGPLPVQSGGTVQAGNPYMVGEGGAEPFFPSGNGRVLGHAESLHALTLGAGGGQTNYFYGHVTLQVGSESGAGLMELRL